MRRWTRWALWVLASTGVLLAIAVGFIFIAIHHLDAPLLKRPLERWILGVAGFEVDWRSIRVDLRSGVHLEGLEVKSPPAFRGRAPDLLRADAVEVDASPFAGIRSVRVTHADVTLVQEGGHGSWERPVKTPAQRQGLSQLLATLFSKPPPIPAASFESSSVTWIKADLGKPVERVRVSGLSLGLQGWTLKMGTAAAPVRLDVKYQLGESVHTVALDAWVAGRAEPRGLAASAEMKVAHQDFAPEFSVEKLLSLYLAAKFDTAHQQLHLDLDRLQLLDDAATLKGSAELPDDPMALPTVHDMDGSVDLKRLASFLAPLRFPVSVDRGTLQFRAKSTDVIDVNGNADTVVFARGGTTASLSGVSLTATLQPRGPRFVRAKLKGHAKVAPAGDKPWFDQDVRVALEADQVAKDFSRAHLRGTVAGPWGEMAIDDQHHAHHETAEITFRLASLTLLRPVLPKVPWPVDWRGASATGKIAVRAQLGSKPQIHQTTKLELQNLAARLPAGPLSVHSLSAELRSEGTDRDHHAEVGLRMAGVQWRGGAPSDQTLDATMDFAAETPRFHLVLKTDGALAPSASAEAQAHFDRSRGELVSELTASASHLMRLAPFLKGVPWFAQFDLAKTEATLAARARLRGVSRFERSMLARARGGAEVEGTLRNVRWFAGEQSAAVSSVRFQATAEGDLQRAAIDGQLEAQGSEYALGESSYSAAPISLNVSGVLKPRSGEANAQGDLTVGQLVVGNSFGYPLEGLKLSFSVERHPNGVIYLPKATLENPAAGTLLELRAGLALRESPPKLSARGSLSQDLLKVWRNPDVFSGQGRAHLDFEVKSSDLTIFNTSAVLTLDGVSLRMQPWGLIAEGVDSKIPFVSELERTSRGFAVIRGRRLNRYSTLRFLDQHPLFNRRSYLSIRRLVTPQVTIESFAGNLSVDHNLISLSQMEMSVRGGHLTGQCLLDIDAKDIRATAELRATGILSSQGEPFDGNAALSVSLRDRSVDGRAEILRVGRQHLLDLLDLQDPRHIALAFNRVRQALSLGYPEQVKITFDRGFANVHIAFGGLAKLVKVDDLRGIPLEPLIDKYLKEVL